MVLTRQRSISSTSRRAGLAAATLGVLAIGFVAYALPPYLTLDPSRARIPDSHGVYYALLVGHVVFASAAMLTSVVQVGSWFRARFPSWHRRIGAVYVFPGPEVNSCVSCAHCIPACW